MDWEKMINKRETVGLTEWRRGRGYIIYINVYGSGRVVQ